MNNLQIHSFNNIGFKSNDDRVVAYDDSVSKQRREFIREHYNSWHTPTIDIYEKEPQQTEYGLQKVINRLKNQPKKFVDKNLLPDMYYMKKIDISPKTNSYRGESLVDAPISEIKKLKDAGIRTVIDLAGYGDNYKEKVEKSGLEFFSYNVDSVLCPSYVEISRENIQKFIKFINKMQQDFVYIACVFGTYKTDNALLLNSFFNPKANKHPVLIQSNTQKEQIQTLFSKLTNEDLKKLGWDKEFKLRFSIMLKKARLGPKRTGFSL